MSRSKDPKKNSLRPIDLSGLKLHSVHDRTHIAQVEAFAGLCEPGASFSQWLQVRRCMASGSEMASRLSDSSTIRAGSRCRKPARSAASLNCLAQANSPAQSPQSCKWVSTVICCSCESRLAR